MWITEKECKPLHGSGLFISTQFSNHNHGIGKEDTTTPNAWQHRSIGKRLIRNVMCIAREVGIEHMEGEILVEDEAVQQLLINMDLPCYRILMAVI